MCKQIKTNSNNGYLGLRSDRELIVNRFRVNPISTQQMANLIGLLFTCVCLFTTTSAEREKSCMRGPCMKGQYEDRIEGCTACPSGFYMDQDNHACPECYPCTNRLPALGEVVKEECTATSDTVLGCADDHYRNESVSELQRIECHKCKDCKDNEVEIKKCDQSSDTLCCRHSNMKAKKMSDGQWKCVDDDENGDTENSQQPQSQTTKGPVSFSNFQDEDLKEKPDVGTIIAVIATIVAILLGGIGFALFCAREQI